MRDISEKDLPWLGKSTRGMSLSRSNALHKFQDFKEPFKILMYFTAQCHEIFEGMLKYMHLHHLYTQHETCQKFENLRISRINFTVIKGSDASHGQCAHTYTVFTPINAPGC